MSPQPESPEPTHLVRLDSPIGRIEITGSEEAVTALTIESNGTLPWDPLPERSSQVLKAAAVQLREYFAGTRRIFDLPVAVTGTPFQESVWHELAAIPFGTVVSYGDIGRETGRVSAGRAVGGAVGANPVPLIVPCHRVLGSDGRVTGYSAGAGIPTKVWLLDHEGIAHR